MKLLCFSLLVALIAVAAVDSARIAREHGFSDSECGPSAPAACTNSCICAPDVNAPGEAVIIFVVWTQGTVRPAACAEHRRRIEGLSQSPGCTQYPGYRLRRSCDRMCAGVLNASVVKMCTVSAVVVRDSRPVPNALNW